VFVIRGEFEMVKWRQRTVWLGTECEDCGNRKQFVQGEVLESMENKSKPSKRSGQVRERGYLIIAERIPTLINPERHTGC
jgi:hypothetical protein